MGGTWECFPYSVPCFLWIVFPQSLAEVINKKKPQRCSFFLFWKWKNQAFFLSSWKTAELLWKKKRKRKKKSWCTKNKWDKYKSEKEMLDQTIWRTWIWCLATSWGLASSQMPKQTGPEQNALFPYFTYSYFRHSWFSNGKLRVFKKVIAKNKNIAENSH